MKKVNDLEQNLNTRAKFMINNISELQNGINFVLQNADSMQEKIGIFL